MDVMTIGFTRTSAEAFFDRIRRAGVRKVIDVRLHNTSQLAGFAKAEDLPFFLRELCGAGYVHEPLLAPTEEIMSAFNKQKGDWNVFREDFLALMSERKVESQFKAEQFDGGCLLCSEDKPHHCHRSLVCDYLNSRWGGALSVKHL